MTWSVSVWKQWMNGRLDLLERMNLPGRQYFYTDLGAVAFPRLPKVETKENMLGRINTHTCADGTQAEAEILETRDTTLKTRIWLS